MTPIILVIGTIGLIIFERIGTYNFNNIIYRISIPVRRMSFSYNREQFPLKKNKTIPQESGRYYVISSRKLLFTTNNIGFGFFKLYSPLKFICTCNLNNESLDIRVRIPLVTSILCVTFIVFGGMMTSLITEFTSENIEIFTILYSSLIIGLIFISLRIDPVLISLIGELKKVLKLTTIAKK